jgi:hypothetical protein
MVGIQPDKRGKMNLNEFCTYKNIPSEQCQIFKVWAGYNGTAKLPLREWEKLWADFLGIELA